ASEKSPRRQPRPGRPAPRCSGHLGHVRPATQLGSLRSRPGAATVRSVGNMNENHARVCTSPEWAQHIQAGILPALTRDVDLGAEMLEIGPGPGAATEW